MCECVKCGAATQGAPARCESCTWPFSFEAWSGSKLPIRRVTLDTGCINAKHRNGDLNTLERWADEERIQLQRSDAMLSELEGDERIAKAEALPEHPGLFVLDESALDDEDVLGGPDLSLEIERLLFPTANPLTENQSHDVAHLRLHVLTGGDVFVTLNPNDFITRGRQESLRSCGIWVLAPSELVKLLKTLYGWP